MDNSCSSRMISDLTDISILLTLFADLLASRGLVGEGDVLSIFLVELNDVESTRFCLFLLDALSCLILFAIDIGDTLVEPVLERPGVGGLRVCVGPSITLCVGSELAGRLFWYNPCYARCFTPVYVIYDSDKVVFLTS